MNGNIAERAMLVTLSISVWTARKHDRRADATIEREYNTAAGTGRYNKVLVAEQAIKAVQTTANTARTYHYMQTLPWTDEGKRLLPATNFQTYSSEMRRLRGEFDAAVARFVSAYPTLVDEARHQLNGLFRQADYPRDIAGKFAWSVDIGPIPTAQDFRVDLAAEEVASIRADIEKSAQSAVQAAHADLYRRLAEAVGHMAEKLNDGKAIFRDSLVENLAEMCELLPRLNVLQDDNLTAILQQVEQKLTVYPPEVLRDNSAARERTAKEAESILSALGAFYGQE